MGTCPSAHGAVGRDGGSRGGGLMSAMAPAFGRSRIRQRGYRCATGVGGVDEYEGDDLEAQAVRRTLVSGVHRWCLDVSEWDEVTADQWEGLLDLLPEAESARVRAFLRENDRRLALGSRLLQRAVVSKVFGVRFSEVDIRRTSESKPFFAGVKEAVKDGSVSPLLKNWNFNISHHGKYVIIASEPACLCGVDIVDTNGRGNETGPAEDYLRYFTHHFTEDEWETIKRPADDRGKLRRFFLHWGLKEAYVKAIGQGLGYDLRRISFVSGEWVDCCSWLDPRDQQQDAQHDQHGRPCTPAPLHQEEGDEKWGDAGCHHDEISTSSARRQQRLQRCSCPRSRSVAGATAAAGLQTRADTGRGRIDRGGGGDGSDSANKPGADYCWGQEDRLGCQCGIGAVAVEVDHVPRPDWSFKVFPFPNGYAACVARGPPSACSPSGRQAGVVSDPDAPERGQSLPQLRFRKVRLEEVVPAEVAARLFGGGL